MPFFIVAHLIQNDNEKTGNKIGEEGVKEMNKTMKKHISRVNLEFDGIINSNHGDRDKMIIKET